MEVLSAPARLPLALQGQLLEKQGLAVADELREASQVGVCVCTGACVPHLCGDPSVGPTLRPHTLRPPVLLRVCASPVLYQLRSRSDEDLITQISEKSLAAAAERG
jgi:hypothetical protein